MRRCKAIDYSWKDRHIVKAGVTFGVTDIDVAGNGSGILTIHF